MGVAMQRQCMHKIFLHLKQFMKILPLEKFSVIHCVDIVKEFSKILPLENFVLSL